MDVIELMKVLGFDIGGANIKATFLKIQDGKVKGLRTLIEYFPLWKVGKVRLTNLLQKLKATLTNSASLEGVGITITAEVSDVYMTKEEGINHVLDCIIEVFRDIPKFVLNVEAILVSIKEARRNPLQVASANWAATGWMIKQLIKNCIIIDVGSTTTSIIPLVDGELTALGKTDLEKLQNGELVYSGSLRTNIATIASRIPVNKLLTRVSSELFSQSGDVHLLLNNIEEKDYSVDTCDGRGKTKREAAARLARVVCADINMLSEQEIIDIAKFVYSKQIEQIACGLKQVYERITPSFQKKIKIVVTGLGRNFLARKAAEKVGFDEIVDMKEILGDESAFMAPSVGLAFMVASKLEEKSIRWKQF